MDGPLGSATETGDVRGSTPGGKRAWKGRPRGLKLGPPSCPPSVAGRAQRTLRRAAFARRLAKHLHLDEDGLSLPAAVPAAWDAEERAATAAEGLVVVGPGLRRYVDKPV